MKFNSFFSTLLLLYACSLSPRTGTQTIAGLAQVEKPPFTIIELSLTPWAAGREEGGTGYLLELTLTEPFTTLDSVIYKGNSAVWKQNSMQVDKAIYTANMQEKSTPQKELILDGDPIKRIRKHPTQSKIRSSRYFLPLPQQTAGLYPHQIPTQRAASVYVVWQSRRFDVF